MIDGHISSQPPGEVARRAGGGVQPAASRAWAPDRLPAMWLCLAWSAALAATVVLLPSQPALGATLVAAAIPCAALALAIRPAVLSLMVVAALLGAARAELPPSDPALAARAAALAGQTATLTGVVADDSRPSAGGSEALIQPDQIVIAGISRSDVGNLVIRWRTPDEAAYGDSITATGKLQLPRDLPTFDRRAYLAQHNAYLELYASSFSVNAAPPGIAGLPGWLRKQYTNALDQSLPAPHAAVLLGVVLGIRRNIPHDLSNALIATGLVHLLVLSGLKVTVFARIAQGFLEPLLGRLAAWPALALIALYALAGGAGPAALRAAAMGGLAIAASRLGRPTHVWTSLAICAAVMLGWRPELAWDVGFQLSFAGTAAIILLTPPIERRLSWCPHVFREPFAVTCAAQLGTLPMSAADFHVLSPIAPFANALALPVLPALIVSGLLLAPMSLVPDVAHLAALPVMGLLGYLEQCAVVLARVPFAAISVPAVPAWAGAAYYSSLGPAIVGAKAEGRRRTVAIALSVLGPVVISGAALAAWAGAPPQAVVLAVGDGQAVLFRSSQGSILIDGGPSPGKLNGELGQHLAPWQNRIDAVAITAPTLGHVGGFAGLNRSAGAILLPDASMTGVAWRTAAFEAVARGATVTRLRAGARIQVAGFTLDAISPEPGVPGDVAGAVYLGLRVQSAGGRSFCDLSDLDVDAQTVAAAHLSGKCTYLLLPDRGRSLLSPELMRAAGSPQLIASLASGRLARGYPPSVLRTDQEGSIALAM